MLDNDMLDNVGRSLDGHQKLIILSSSALRIVNHVKLLVSAAFAVVSTHQKYAGPVLSYGPFSLSVIHKEGLCPSSGDINRLMLDSNRASR
jgi:hypothetical protein